MTDDETRVKPADQAGPAHYGEALLYDLAKFITTLSLLILGGLLTVREETQAGELKPTSVILVAVAVAIAGVLAFSAATSLADARARGREPQRWLPLQIRASGLFMGVGVGAFLAIWLDTLS
ncbi:hypothetical protein [Sphingomonas lenta]|uniref:Uncharacterized protein n=1 Tax=Sphingomonas lenta TaxID=1141887 RepID=A0A2A2SG64_9SPHN|nr:hypothetical protein [Sphingomonas lenta]PAX08180.1 hypothetical protein CKY28_11425 [Sphingomonas lenta]